MIKGTEQFIVNPEQKFTEAAVTKDEKEKRRKKKKEEKDDSKIEALPGIMDKVADKLPTWRQSMDFLL